MKHTNNINFWNVFHNHLIQLNLKLNILHISDKVIKNVKDRI